VHALTLQISWDKGCEFLCPFFNKGADQKIIKQWKNYIRSELYPGQLTVVIFFRLNVTLSMWGRNETVFHSLQRTLLPWRRSLRSVTVFDWFNS